MVKIIDCTGNEQKIFEVNIDSRAKLKEVLERLGVCLDYKNALFICDRKFISLEDFVLPDDEVRIIPPLSGG